MKIIYIFVEGEDDEIFLKYFLKRFSLDYDKIIFWKYAQKKKSDNIKLLNSIKQVKDWDYFIFADFDSRESLNQRKREIQKKFGNEVDNDKLFIVIEEIESWFAAGIDFKYFDLEKLKYIKDTQEITKEFFNSQCLGKYHPKTHFLIEIMKRFQLKQSLDRNLSLNYTYYKLLGDNV